MYHTGELIKFSPFVFKNGNQPKGRHASAKQRECVSTREIHHLVSPLWKPDACVVRLATYVPLQGPG